MKGFFSKLTKIHPSPSIPDQSRKNSDGNVPNSLQLSPSMIFSKKRTLQTQSFSPRPILKKKSVSGQKRPSLHSEDDENILINSESNNHETIPRRKTKKLSKIYPDSKRSSEETDFAMKKTLKKREKLAELKKFDEKFDQNKLAEKAKKFSLKRSNTMVYKEEKNKKNSSVSFQNSLQRPSEGNLPSPNRFKEENLDDNFFKDIHDENRLSPSYNNVDFSEEGVKVDNFKIHKKITLRKQRVNYRLRFDEKYKKIKFIIFPDDPFRTKWDLIVLGYNFPFKKNKILFWGGFLYILR